MSKASSQEANQVTSPKPSRGKSLGQLEIAARTARNLPHKVLVGKQSPFVQFKLGSITKQTICDKRGGRNPQWNDLVTFELFDDVKTLNVILLNRKSKTQSDFLGEVHIELDKVIKQRELDAWFSLKDRFAYAGDVYIEFTFYPKGEPKALAKKEVNAINAIEEELSILQLKNIRHDISTNIVELPKDRTLLRKQEAIVNGEDNIDENSQILSEEVFSPSMETSKQYNLNNQSKEKDVELGKILEEIQNIVDSPNPTEFINPVLENQESSPGALPKMKGKIRKPLPQLPSKAKQKDTMPTTNTSLSEIEELNKKLKNVQYEDLLYHQQNSMARSPSIAPSSMISELILNPSTPSIAMSRRTSQRRNSIETIHKTDSHLDFDPRTEIQTTDAATRTPSIRRRAQEAPSVLEGLSQKVEQSFHDPNALHIDHPKVYQWLHFNDRYVVPVQYPGRAYQKIDSITNSTSTSSSQPRNNLHGYHVANHPNLMAYQPPQPSDYPPPRAFPSPIHQPIAYPYSPNLKAQPLPTQHQQQQPIHPHYKVHYLQQPPRPLPIPIPVPVAHLSNHIYPHPHFLHPSSHVYPHPPHLQRAVSPVLSPSLLPQPHLTPQLQPQPLNSSNQAQDLPIPQSDIASPIRNLPPTPLLR